MGIARQSTKSFISSLYDRCMALLGLPCTLYKHQQLCAGTGLRFLLFWHQHLTLPWPQCSVRALQSLIHLPKQLVFPELSKKSRSSRPPKSSCAASWKNHPVLASSAREVLFCTWLRFMLTAWGKERMWESRSFCSVISQMNNDKNGSCLWRLWEGVVLKWIPLFPNFPTSNQNCWFLLFQ